MGEFPKCTERHEVAAVPASALALGLPAPSAAACVTPDGAYDTDSLGSLSYTATATLSSQAPSSHASSVRSAGYLAHVCSIAGASSAGIQDGSTNGIPDDTLRIS